MYLARTLSNVIVETSKTFPVILITGPRQVGKSTILEQIKEESRVCVTLDDRSNEWNNF